MRTTFLPHSIIVALLAVTVGCSATTQPPSQIESDLAAARARWAAARPSSYEFVSSTLCFCPMEITAPVTVTVTGTTVSSRRYVSTGANVDGRFASSFPTIDGYFAVIDSARTRHPARIDVTYDPALGYPTRIAIDFVLNATDDEITYTIGGFRTR